MSARLKLGVCHSALKPFGHCPRPVHHKPIVPNQLLSLMVDFADSALRPYVRPYERGIAEACERHSRNSNPVLYLGRDFGKLPSGTRITCRLLRINRSPLPTGSYQAETTMPVYQSPLRSPTGRLNFDPAGQASPDKAIASLKTGVGRTFFSHG